ncbi:MAG: glucuronyl hydrolase, partial [Alistipes sp.]|nr:glucuronyl hydrolase [Alistipes sp.]
QADIPLRKHFRDYSRSSHVVSYNDDGTVESRGTFQGYADESTWARGQAWGLYGYTMCYRETGDEKYLEQAERIADLIMNHPRTPEDRIPYWDYDAPQIPDAPRDASAAAVFSSALFELSTLVDEGQKYFDYAETLLMSLSSDAYLAQKGTNGGFILMHSVGHWPATSEIDTPLNYADYYYLEAIARYLKLRGIDPRTL